MSTPTPVPATPAPVTAGAIPWYQSTDQKLKIATGVAILVAAFPKSSIVAKFGLSNPEEVTGYINGLSFVAPFVPLIWGFIARTVSKIQPLTLTKAAAAADTSTIALARTQAAMRRAGIPLTTELQTQLQTNADTAAAAVAALPPGAPAQTLSQLSPEVVHSLASAVADEIARRQALYRAIRAAHPTPLVPTAATALPPAAPAAPIVQPPEIKP